MIGRLGSAADPIEKQMHHFRIVVPNLLHDLKTERSGRFLLLENDVLGRY
ncbi:MAG: hypothetical protein K0Q73_561 [Paenibacillus sp.]|jgi:hypothetical protein|nr:hypothetical protein [Paenibacillus sp.]